MAKRRFINRVALSFRNRRVLDAESMREINRKIVQSKAANDSTFIHGNRNSKIYHLFDCPSYNAMKSSNIINFKTEQEAQEKGFRKAKNCP